MSSNRTPRFRIAASLIGVAILCAAGLPNVAGASTSKSHAKKTTTTTSAKPSSKKSSTAKSASGKSASTKSKAGKSSASKSTAKSASAAKSKVCYETVKRKGKAVKVKKPCGEPAETVVTKSPINARSLENSGTPLDGSPVKARSAPIRAYAVDGSTFFHNGRKIVVEGLGPEASAGLTHEHSAQRLQRLLDGGTVSIDPVSADENGALRARVRVDGRDVADLMRAQP
ncbi:hypothetical protein [Niveibacterium sp.]|uniref:hypothetical protein n=1 Tax=Niveibacterium sp. TaxID=2017444 RepID=UPI0035B0D638